MGHWAPEIVATMKAAADEPVHLFSGFLSEPVVKLAEVLAERPAVTDLVATNELDGLLDPERYTGTAAAQVDRLAERLGPRAL